MFGYLFFFYFYKRYLYIYTITCFARDLKIWKLKLATIYVYKSQKKLYYTSLSAIPENHSIYFVIHYTFLMYNTCIDFLTLTIFFICKSRIASKKFKKKNLFINYFYNTIYKKKNTSNKIYGEMLK